MEGPPHLIYWVQPHYPDFLMCHKFQNYSKLCHRYNKVGTPALPFVYTVSCVGASHMSDNRHMSVAMQRLVDFISMVNQQYVTMQQK
jgi:hypothetical protein